MVCIVYKYVVWIYVVIIIARVCLVTAFLSVVIVGMLFSIFCITKRVWLGLSVSVNSLSIYGVSLKLFLRGIGHFKEYHSILKIVIWVVLHVNLTFALSFGMICTCNAGQFVKNLHTQRISHARAKYTLLILSFITFRGSATTELSWKFSLIREKCKVLDVQMQHSFSYSEFYFRNW